MHAGSEEVHLGPQCLTTVGIDIGSATTQVLLSRLWLEVTGDLITSRLRVVHREALHASPLVRTPINGNATIDTAVVRDIVATAYAAAGLTAHDVEMGALVVTGEAARTDNATATAAAVADLAGSFVCVAAGPHLESRLAAHGSGAVQLSAARPTETILHIDVGGATTKLAVVVGGVIVESAAANVGARMLTFEAGRITGVTPALSRLARVAGVPVQVGQPATPELRARLADLMAVDLLEFIRGVPRPPDDVMDEPVTPPLCHRGPFDVVGYSGGVAAYIYGDQLDQFGDLGVELAAALKRRLAALGGETVRSARTIRATVVGASQFSAQVSGTTTYCSGNSGLPARGLRVVPVEAPAGQLTAGEMEQVVRRAHADVDLPPGAVPAIMALRWHGDPSYARLAAVADGIHTAMPTALATGVFIAVDADLGGSLGSLLSARRPDSAVVCIDEVVLDELDIVDIGRPVSVPAVVPVTLRSIYVR